MSGLWAKKGFTLIELILILSFLGIMVFVYIESAGDMSEISLDAASRKCQQDIRYAQQLAQTTGVPHGVVFYAGGGYQVYRGSPGNPVTDPATRQAMIENFAKYPGVQVSSNFQVQFDASGRPVMGGNQRATLMTGGAVRDIYIVDRTGAVVIDITQGGSGCALVKE